MASWNGPNDGSQCCYDTGRRGNSSYEVCMHTEWKGEGKEVMDEDGKERAEPFSRETGLGAKV